MSQSFTLGTFTGKSMQVSQIGKPLESETLWSQEFQRQNTQPLILPSTRVLKCWLRCWCGSLCDSSSSSKDMQWLWILWLFVVRRDG